MSDQFSVDVQLPELSNRGYEIRICSDDSASFADCLKDWASQRDGNVNIPGSALVVTDRNIVESHANVLKEALVSDGWRCELFPMEPGETSKSLSAISQVYDQLVAMKADRQTIIVAIGGGVVGDSAGFVAATYARGIPYVQVPTTLLAQVDSSVGGKVAVNHTKAKNLIGAFYQPLGVFIDTNTLNTLPERDYRSGLAEVVKYGVILDVDFFAYLEENIDAINARKPEALRRMVGRSCELKAEVVNQDEFERTGIRAALNYGHTFAHAFEALAGYGELLHGEAVSIGMIYASRLAERKNLIDESVTQRQLRLLSALNLPVALPEGVSFSTDAILERMLLDKKTVGGQLRFILPTKLGLVETFKDIAEADVRGVLDSA